MSTNENTIKVRKFSNPLKVARANLKRCESLYKSAIRSGVKLAKTYQDYIQARYNYNLLKG